MRPTRAGSGSQLAPRLTIRTRPPTPIQADGELIATAATEIVYEIVPGALRVFSPE